MEEHFKAETKDYLTTIKRLQEENRKLSSSLTAANERDRWAARPCSTVVQLNVCCSGLSEDENYIEIDLVNKLQSIVERQREQLRGLDTELSSVKADLEEARGQTEKLGSSNKVLVSLYLLHTGNCTLLCPGVAAEAATESGPAALLGGRAGGAAGDAAGPAAGNRHSAAPARPRRQGEPGPRTVRRPGARHEGKGD